MRRVVVTGMGGISPLGSDWKNVSDRLRSGKSSIRCLDELAQIVGMDTRLASLVDNFEIPDHYPRKKVRSMGRVSRMATRASEEALIDAGLQDDPILSSGRMGISYGSTSGSPPAMMLYTRNLATQNTIKGIRAIDYIQCMSHTVAANLAQFFEIKGRVVTTCSACTSGSQGIGYGYEAIQSGKQDVMLTGGAEEYHVIDSAVFDIMYATSTKNETPESTPRPFDRERDGLVVGEGAGTLVLEERDRAIARGARVHAEVVGYGTNCDGRHVTNPDTESMHRVMRLALDDAELSPEAIGFVSAHGTATQAGDIAETLATNATFGSRMPISSLKSFMGHTLGACGALEAWLSIEMMREGWFSETLNLDNIDPNCGELDYIMNCPREIDTEYVMSNNFAFGGVNTSLIFKR